MPWWGAVRRRGVQPLLTGAPTASLEVLAAEAAAQHSSSKSLLLRATAAEPRLHLLMYFTENNFGIGIIIQNDLIFKHLTTIPGGIGV